VEKMKADFYAYNRNLQPFANWLRKMMTKAEAWRLNGMRPRLQKRGDRG
jgi:hypothetical protein